MGSNPIEDAHGTVRQLVERPSSNLGLCGFESHPCYSFSRGSKNRAGLRPAAKLNSVEYANLGKAAILRGW